MYKYDHNISHHRSFLFYKMQETKIVIVVASGCSALAIIACLMVIPFAYKVIEEIGDEVLNEVQVCV